MFQQHIRGLLNKSEILISLLCPDFPQVLCLTEHIFKCTEIDFMYVDQYKLGTKFYRESLKNDGVSIFCMIPVNVQILIKTNLCSYYCELFALYLSIDHQQEIFYIFKYLRLLSQFLTQQHN